ncbi:MAG: hypothetical protein ACYCOU_18910, partial [Sulfobacillus sp.]
GGRFWQRPVGVGIRSPGRTQDQCPVLAAACDTTPRIAPAHPQWIPPVTGHAVVVSSCVRLQLGRATPDFDAETLRRVLSTVGA